MLIARADTVAERANEDALFALADRDAPIPATLPLAERSAARKRGRRLRFGLLLIGFDCAAILIAVALAALLRFGADAGQEFGRIATITLAAYLLVAANGSAFRLGDAIQGETAGRRRALLAFALSSGLILGAVFYIKASESFSRIALGLVLLLGLAALAGGRALFAWLAGRWLTGPILHETVLLDGIEMAVAPETTLIDAVRLQLSPRLDDPAMLAALGCCLHGSDRVIVGCSPERRQAWADALRGAGVSVEMLMPELDRMRAFGINLFGQHTTLTVAAGPLGHGDRALKRALDLAIVFGSAPLVLPVLLLAAIAIRLESRGPICFVQQRVGQGNRLFRMIKLRTMRHEAGDAAGSVSTQRDDARVTRVGALLRRTSIDELPQLWNVLTGEMSVVGPRPHALGSRAADVPFWALEVRYWERHAAKPGMTGLAQVRGLRGSIHDRDALAQRVSSDLAYLQSWTIWRDLLIIGRTFRVLVHANAF